MSTIDNNEINHFNTLADEWWDVDGKFKILHTINPLRISFIVENCKSHFNNNFKLPLQSLELLDIGCGGGLIAEPMCKIGANVTAIDASLNNIQTASIHAKSSELDINYLHISAEELAKTGKVYDVILAIEVIEHVNDYELFLNSIKALLKPRGLLFISTINRNFKSLLLAKIAAEYLLGWVPKGTHDWNKFLTPEEINSQLSSLSISIRNKTGMSFNPFSKSWHLSDDFSLNYIICAKNGNS